MIAIQTRKESVSQSREVKTDIEQEEPDFCLPAFMHTEHYNYKDHSWCCSTSNPAKIVPSPQLTDPPPYNLHAVVDGILPVVGVHEGLRPYMEDRHRMISSVDGLRGFYSICDGHGGSEAPQYVAEYLYEDLLFAVDKVLGRKDNKELPHDYEDEDAEEVVHALERGSMSCETQLLDAARTYAFTSGTTAISVMVRGNHLYCINVGDSRAVMCRANGQVLELSQDHKPSDTKEVNRITAAGGEVGRLQRPVAIFCCFGEKTEPYGAVRVWPGGLSVSRTMGDVVFKDPSLGKTHSDKILVATADVQCVELLKDDEFVILGSDGFWDVFSSADAVKFVYKKRNTRKFNPQTIAKRLADRAYAFGSTDNITVIVLFFTHYQDDWERPPYREAENYLRGDYTPLPRPLPLQLPSAEIYHHQVADFAPYKETPKAETPAIELVDLQNPIEISKKGHKASPSESPSGSPNASPAKKSRVPKPTGIVPIIEKENDEFEEKDLLSEMNSHEYSPVKSNSSSVSSDHTGAANHVGSADLKSVASLREVSYDDDAKSSLYSDPLRTKGDYQRVNSGDENHIIDTSVPSQEQRDSDNESSVSKTNKKKLLPTEANANSVSHKDDVK